MDASAYRGHRRTGQFRDEPDEWRQKGVLVRDGTRRLSAAAGAIAALGVAAAFVGRPSPSHLAGHSFVAAAASQRAAQRDLAGQQAAPGDAVAAAGDAVAVDGAYARAAAGQAAGGSWLAAAGVRASGGTGVSSPAVQVAGGDQTADESATPIVAPLHRLHPADLLVVAPKSLRPGVAAAVRHLAGVTADVRIDAASIRVNGKFVQMLGVSPSSFRGFAAGPTARSTSLWRSVARGDVAISDEMGKQDKLPLGSSVHVAGQQPEALRVGGYGTVGISGVDAVVSDSVARSLGIPAGNALVISAPHAQLATLMKKVKAVLPHDAGIAQLVAQADPGAAVAQDAAAGAAGSVVPAASSAPTIDLTQVRAFLKAALSRVGMPYVWGAAGPRSFDCSGLVQWSMRQAGIVMPRVAVDQARTGPRVALSQLAPGDLLFYHTDASAPTYISHVAIYLGNGLMEQAPEPGMNVQIVKADFGAGFAGAVQVSPALAAAVAANPAG
jgi:peptidoglycan DL-endopeptidase CwlO